MVTVNHAGATALAMAMTAMLRADPAAASRLENLPAGVTIALVQAAEDC